MISAKLGTVALAAGNAITLDVAGDGLLNVTVNQGAVNALVQNGGLIQADGGQVLLTAQAAGNLLQSVVNNTGVIQAQTIENHNGTIRLLGDMQSGTVNVGGTLDASAPNGGNGGFIETSAANVNIASDAKITTAAPLGLTGTWLIDPQDFTIDTRQRRYQRKRGGQLDGDPEHDDSDIERRSGRERECGNYCHQWKLGGVLWTRCQRECGHYDDQWKRFIERRTQCKLECGRGHDDDQWKHYHVRRTRCKCECENYADQ